MSRANENWLKRIVFTDADAVGFSRPTKSRQKPNTMAIMIFTFSLKMMASAS